MGYPWPSQSGEDGVHLTKDGVPPSQVWVGVLPIQVRMGYTPGQDRMWVPPGQGWGTPQDRMCLDRLCHRRYTSSYFPQEDDTAEEKLINLENLIKTFWLDQVMNMLFIKLTYYVIIMWPGDWFAANRWLNSINLRTWSIKNRKSLIQYEQLNIIRVDWNSKDWRNCLLPMMHYPLLNPLCM